jgi:hypothetical protein
MVASVADGCANFIRWPVPQFTYAHRFTSAPALTVVFNQISPRTQGRGYVLMAANV